MLGPGDYNVGFNSSEAEDWDDWAYYGNFGLADQTEVGLYLWRPDNPAAEETYLHAKRAVTSADENPQVAVGVFDITDETETTVYAVATWEQGQVVGTVDGREVRFLHLSGGFAAGQFEDFFAGAQLAFGEEFELLAEFVDDDLNVGARLRPVRDFNIDLGLMDWDDFAINVSY
ncbi:MAG: hypothetical protein AB7Y46_03160, partial [Armatimonadota bacterium]